MRTQEEQKKHERRQNIIAVAILILGTFFAYLIFAPKKNNDTQVSNQGPAQSAALVKTMEIKADGSRVAKLEKTATWEAGSESAEAVSEYSGRIKSVSFEVGDRVAEGQVLAIFDQSNIENSPKASFESAQKSYNLAEENLSDIKDVTEKTIDLAERALKVAKIQRDQVENDSTSTKEEKDLAKQNVKIAEDQKEQAEESTDVQKNGAQIQLEQARLALNQSRIAYENTIVKSPISGTVVSKNITGEDFLNPGDKVAEIVGNGKLEAIVYLNQNEIERIKTGDSAEIKIGEKTYPGIVSSYSGIANSGNERFEAKIISENNMTEKANSTGSVILNAYLESSDSFFVPLDAVNIGQDKKEVFIVENEKAIAKSVELGKIIGTQIEVLSGLKVGDVLVIENSRNLTDGQSVRPEA